MNNKDVIYFDSFGVKYIAKEIKTSINNRIIETNIFRVQSFDLVMCGYFCIEYIDFIFKGKILTEYTNLFSPNNFQENDDLILSYFKNE